MAVSRREFVLLGPLVIPPGLAAQSGVDVRVLQIFNAINRIRRERRLAALSWDDRVAAAARRHSENMAERDFFSHEDPVHGGLAARLDRAGIPWNLCAENIFQEQGHRDLAAIAVQSWMESPGHRANILNPKFTHTGLGLATRKDASNWLDQIFTRPPARP